MKFLWHYQGRSNLCAHYYTALPEHAVPSCSQSRVCSHTTLYTYKFHTPWNITVQLFIRQPELSLTFSSLFPDGSFRSCFFSLGLSAVVPTPPAGCTPGGRRGGGGWKGLTIPMGSWGDRRLSLWLGGEERKPSSPLTGGVKYGPLEPVCVCARARVCVD